MNKQTLIILLFAVGLVAFSKKKKRKYILKVDDPVKISENEFYK